MHPLNRQLSRLVLVIFLAMLFLILPTRYSYAQITNLGVAATADSLSTQIAYDILNQGGNAIDAGVASMFALTVTQPFAASMGGGGLMLIWNNQTHEATMIDFRSVAPKTIDPAIFYKDQETFNIYTKYGFQSICVPGMVAGATKALALQGTIPMKELLEPTIQLASSEIEVSEALANLITENYDRLESNHASSAIFLPDWFPLKKNKKFKREDLALTLNLISSNSGAAFYRGEIATDICNEASRNNGFIQLSDFASYNAESRGPTSGTYRNFQIFSIPPPASGGVALIQLLKILEKFDLKKIDFNSGPYIHLVVEAMKLVHEDQEKIWNNPGDFDERLFQSALSSENIMKKVNQIDSARIKVVIRQDSTNAPAEIPGNTHISIIDRSGNAVSISLSLNSIFGSGVTISKYGILLNNSMRSFSADASDVNAIKPGKRPKTTLAPTLVTKNNRPFLVLGGNGNDPMISMLAHIIIGVVDYNLSLNDAIAAPRFHYNYETDTIEMETRIEAKTIEYVKRLGHKINLRKDYDVFFGSAQGVLFDPIDANFYAANDVRHNGVVYINYQN